MASPLVELTGSDLSVSQLVAIAERSARVRIAPEAAARVTACHEMLQTQIASAVSGAADDIYGVTTGFGNFKNRRIAPDVHPQHQLNLIRSHCVGAGLTSDVDDPGNSFAPEVVRAILALRINSLLGGHSGPRLGLIERMLAFLDADILPEVPLRGSVGASGDLCPLSHVALGLLGEGRARHGASPYRPIVELLDAAGLSPTWSLVAKEGLALVNGTTVTTALAALNLARAKRLVSTADAAAALSFEAVCGRLRALDARVHRARPHPGQVSSAERMRELLAGSRLANLAADRQDPYCLRCAPQVHGATRQALEHCREVITIELNSTSDNPLLFDDSEDSVDSTSAAPERGCAYSAGNFHAQPIALAMDYLGIAVAELASISERRVQLLLDEHHNRGLPSNLAVTAGLRSGLLLTQYLAAALVSENKVLAHPASVDSIPTASNAEDHVSMGTYAARKAGSICDNVEAVLAVELLVAAQAVEWRLHAHAANPTGRPPAIADNAIPPAPPTEASLSSLGRGTRALFASVRAAVRFAAEDRVLSGDIAQLRKLVANGAFAAPP